MTPAWVSENGNLCAANGFGNLMSPETGAHCFDKGPFRGARFLSAERKQRPADARRREIDYRAFLRFRHSRNTSGWIEPPRRISSIRERPPAQHIASRAAHSVTRSRRRHAQRPWDAKAAQAQHADVGAVGSSWSPRRQSGGTSMLRPAKRG